MPYQLCRVSGRKRGQFTPSPALCSVPLITDVGLPGGMNGRQMADAARVSRPDLKVLFITGYAETTAVLVGNQART